MINQSRRTIVQGVLFLSGVSLAGYVIYRYTLFHPPDHGTLYGKIFPLSIILAAFAMALAINPYLLASVRGKASLIVRGVATALSAVWMATGLMCARSLMEGISSAPLGGAIDMTHMLSDHVLLPLGIGALMWAPEQTLRWLGDRGGHPALADESALGAGRE